MKLIKATLFFTSVFFLTSCVSKKYLPENYLVKKGQSSNVEKYVIPETKIQKDDILTVQIISDAPYKEIDEIYNQPAISGVLGQQIGNRTLGYQVDNQGFIELPRIGKFKVEGITKTELEREILKRLQEPVKVLENPIVIVRFQNFRISVLGAVAREGVMSIQNERITIWEALGLAGGINEYGIKETVEVIREVDGRREIGVVNLTSDSLFVSPYYHLKQNDVVLVKSNFRRVYSNEQANSTRTVSLIIAVTSLAATLYNIFSK